MIVVAVGTLIGTVGAIIAVHYLKIWLRKVARK